MLSTQRREFEEKKKDESPYPRNFSRWFALDYFRRARFLKARRFYLTLSVTFVFALGSLASMVPAFHRVHQAGPVSRAHAMLQNDCTRCHDQTFAPALRLFGCADASVSDKRCNDCHHAAPHQRAEDERGGCAKCHQEHRGHESLTRAVADGQCVSCHGDPDRGSIMFAGPSIPFQPVITHFNRDHPEFRPTRAGMKDPSKIKFSHKAHLDLDLDELRRALEKSGVQTPAGLGSELACANCHQMDDERKYVKPISYDNHCARCHPLTMPLVGDFAPPLKKEADAFARTPLPHKEPVLVRAALRDRLVEFAQKNKIVMNKEGPTVPRPLPWKPVTDEQWAWAVGRANQAEAVLFMNKQWSKIEPLASCSHCHVEKDRVGGLPVYEESSIPNRWHSKSVFNHGSHRSMNCVDCHDRNAAGMKVAESRSATDILIPTLQSCQECHRGPGGARNACVECHRYHQR